MNEWWSSLDGTLQIFYLIGFTSSAILVIQLILNILGIVGEDIAADAHIDVDAPDVDSPDVIEHSSGLGILSVRTIIAFFVGFGWTGVAMIEGKNPMHLSLLVAMGVGLVFLYSVFLLMKGIFALSESGNIESANAVGKTGTVYIPIPKKGEGVGQIQIVIQGRLREIPAMTKEEQVIPTGTPVKVLEEVTKGTMLVARI